MTSCVLERESVESSCGCLWWIGEMLQACRCVCVRSCICVYVCVCVCVLSSLTRCEVRLMVKIVLQDIGRCHVRMTDTSTVGPFQIEIVSGIPQHDLNTLS